ncbi:rhomboid family intramembrane serine protease [Marimonas sp. MJW-29]|uniref:Rhomboid family intramembrane serine protease n=1 Tax=Sulfitobacter sediminis TaxID=3234186 RepID=A0ABV3RMW4_9RHOB
MIEASLTLSDLGIFGPAHMRQIMYFNGAFWPGLLHDWKPNYAAQPYTMFITFSFLHGGLVHLTVNMITLWSLGRAVLDRVGQVSFIVIYFAATLGAAAVFALLAPTLRPMVGASGALFGLLGAVLAWEYVANHADDEGRWRVAMVILVLLALNLVLWWAMDGQLAWQAHLGGFLTGWLLAFRIRPKPQRTA